MRQDVYTKFAEAVQRKQAEQATVIRQQEVVTKFAEALNHQMAQKQAEAIYCEGFCKAAELAGVDPNALVKQAIGLGSILSLGQKAIGATKAIGGAARNAAAGTKQVYQGAGGGLSGIRAVGSRFGQLLAGGDKAVTDGVTRLEKIKARSAGGGIINHIKARLGTLRGNYSEGARNAAQREFGTAMRYDALPQAKSSPYARSLVDGHLNRAVGLEARGNQLAAGESELRKVLAARLGAGAAATGAAGAGAYAMSGDDQQNA